MKRMTPKEYVERLYIDYDMIIYTSFDYKEQIKSCIIKDLNNTINALEFVSLRKEAEYYKNALEYVENHFNSLS